MTANSRRHILAREEIGILLSFATHPEAVTDEWIQRLEHGVLREELLEFFSLAGLPKSTAAAMIAGYKTEPTAAHGEWAQRSIDYKRALIAVVAVYIVGAVVMSVASGDSLIHVTALAGAFMLVGKLIHTAIVRLSAG